MLLTCLFRSSWFGWCPLLPRHSHSLLRGRGRGSTETEPVLGFLVFAENCGYLQYAVSDGARVQHLRRLSPVTRISVFGAGGFQLVEGSLKGNTASSCGSSVVC